MIVSQKTIDRASYQDLKELETYVAQAKARKADTAKLELKAKLAAMAQDLGFDLADVVAAHKAAPKAAVVPVRQVLGPPVQAAANGNGKHTAPHKAKPLKRHAVKALYRDPTNPANTWSGRGKPTRWLAALIKQGHKLDEYRI